MSKKKYTSESGREYEIHGGHFTGYSYTNDKGQKSVFGFENMEEAKVYIEEAENGDRHFADNIKD